MSRALALLLGLGLATPAAAFTLDRGGHDWPATEDYCYYNAPETGSCEVRGVSNDTVDGATDLGVLAVGGLIDLDDHVPGSPFLGVFGSDQASLSHGSQLWVDDAGEADVWFHYLHALIDGIDVDIDWYRFTTEDAQCVDVCFGPASSYPEDTWSPSLDWRLEVLDADLEPLGEVIGLTGACASVVADGEVFLRVTDPDPTPRSETADANFEMYRVWVDNSGGDVQRRWYPDDDDDGFGDETSEGELICGDPGASWSLDNTDCDDGWYLTWPDAPEQCDGRDNDCDGQPDDGLPFAPYWPDLDGDGWGDAAAAPEDFCRVPREGYAPRPHDCDDDEERINPEAEEVCNEIDDNCDGRIDEGLTTPYWPDADGDAWGDSTAEPSFFCENPGDGWSIHAGDCDDGDADVNPKAEEVCNGVDDDCNGLVDDGLEGELYYPDEDGDGFGDQGCAPVSFCDDPGDGWSTTRDDCDDTDPATYPSAPEIPYDGIDQDCDGFDECDVDGDGFFAPECGGDDCDDADADIHPGAPDAWYDGVDSDCAGNDDYDQDGDGHASAEYADVYDGELPVDDCLDTDPGVITECERTWAQGGLGCSTGSGTPSPWALGALLLLGWRRRG